MTDRVVRPAPSRRRAITAIFAALDAPPWAAPNLDGLADVLRDLSWLPPGPVILVWRASSQLPPRDRRVIEAVLHAAQQETAGGPRPVVVRGPFG